MVIKAKKGFYDNLSRKELQSMCRLYGLPANKSHSQLEKSLLAFLEEGINNSICNLQKASHSKIQRKSSAEKFLSFSKEDVVGFRPDTERRDADYAFSHPIESSAKSHSSPFQLFVRSEDGLNLYVDLNSSPSDWIKKFKSEIHIIENVQQNKSWTLHDDLVCLKDGENGMRSSEEIRDENVGGQSYLYSKVENVDRRELDRPEMCEMSLDPFSVQIRSVSLDASEKSMENQPPSCRNSDSPSRTISVADSCARGNFTVILDSDAIDSPDERKSNEDIIVNSISGYPLSHAILDHANVDLNRCQNMQNDSSLPNPAMVYPRFSASSLIEMQSSEVASYFKDGSGLNCHNGGPVGDFEVEDNKESEKSRLTNSSELNHLPVSAEERERSDSLNERESSECSQFTNPDNSDSGGGHQRKRKRVEAEHPSVNSQANVKILRSMKRKKDLPRRSMRLMSK